MTALGKILVFFNLLFSLVVGGLIVVVFLTRTNWKTGYEDAAKQVKIIGDALNAEKVKAKEDLQVRDALVAKVQGDLNAVNQKLTDAINELNREREKLKAAEIEKSKEGANNQAITQDVERMKQERAQYIAVINDRDNKIGGLEKQAVAFRNRAVAAELSLETAQQRVEKLMMQVEALLKENADMKARGGAIAGPGGPGGGPATKPLPIEVRASVTSVAGDLAQISAGSDAGVAIGNVLEVYRLGGAPQYMGKLTITAVKPHEAVGQFTPVRRGETIRKDDQAATRIIGGGR